MAGIACKDKLMAVDVAEHVIDRIGVKKLKWAKEEYKGAELRVWLRMQINLYGQPEASSQLRDRAVTKVIEYMYSKL